MKRSGSVDRGCAQPGITAMRVKSVGGDASKRASSLSGRASSISGRPSSLSGRPSFGVGSNMSDFRPLSSGGSAHRPRSAIPRASQGSSRPSKGASGRGAAGGSEYSKDTRPLHDKAFRERCINEILEFMAARGFQSLVPRKSLTNPNSTDFIRIFELLVGCIIPNYKIKNKNKLEEEVPKLLKDIGYPYNIPRSYMSTIGAQHTWPTILGALMWLKNLIEISSRCNVESIIFPLTDEDRGNLPQNRILFEFIVDTYNHFMSGNDTFEEQIESLKKSLVNNLGLADIDEDIEDIEREVARNQRVLDDLENQPNDLANYQDQRAALKVDVAKLTRYTTHMEQYVSEQKSTAKQLEEEEKALMAELAAAEKQLKDKEELIAVQGARGVDVHQLGLQHTTLRRRLARKEQYVREIDTEIHKTETALLERRENVEKIVSEYRKVTPSLLAVAPGLYPELTGEISEKEMGRVQELKMMLHNLITQSKQRIDAMEQRHRVMCDEGEQLQDCLNDYEQQMEELKVKEARLDEQMQQRKEEHQVEMDKLQREIDSKRSEKAALSASASKYRSVEEAQQTLDQFKAKLAAQKLKNETELRRRRAELHAEQESILKKQKALEEKVEARADELTKKMDEKIKQMNRESDEVDALYEELTSQSLDDK